MCPSFTSGPGTYGVSLVFSQSSFGFGPGVTATRARLPLPSPDGATITPSARTGEPTVRRAIPSNFQAHSQLAAPVSGSYPASPAVLETITSAFPPGSSRTKGLDEQARNGFRLAAHSFAPVRASKANSSAGDGAPGGSGAGFFFGLPS